MLLCLVKKRREECIGPDRIYSQTASRHLPVDLGLELPAVLSLSSCFTKCKGKIMGRKHMLDMKEGVLSAI